MKDKNDKVEKIDVQTEKDNDKNYFIPFENVSEIVDYFSATGEVSNRSDDEDCFKPFSDVNDIISYFNPVDNNEDNSKERRGR